MCEIKIVCYFVQVLMTFIDATQVVHCLLDPLTVKQLVKAVASVSDCVYTWSVSGS